MIDLIDVSKSYGPGLPAVNHANLHIDKGEFVFVVGNSGSGKSTMLNCIGGLDTMDSGSVKVDGNEISGLNADELSEYRRANLGFIFQFYNLVPNLTVKENIEICQFLTEDPLDMEELILDLIDYNVEDEFDEDPEEGTITIYGDPKSYAAIQKHLEECGFEEVGGDFTYIPNDLKDVTPEQRETLDKMVERLEEFDDVQTVYTNMKPASEEEE